MKISLNLNGSSKEFYSKELTARASLKAFEYLNDLDNRLEQGDKLYGQEQIELLLDFVLSLFGGQFSEAEFLDGYEGSFFSDIPEMLRCVVAGFTAKINEFPNVETPKGKK